MDDEPDYFSVLCFQALLLAESEGVMWHLSE